MDQSIVAVEESHWRSDFVASASKPLESLVPINSIAIDLSCAMVETESPVHEHFSIRAFVAGMRSKDRNMCLPFGSEGGGDIDDLPRLSVPRYRWWQCPECVPEISTKRTTQEMLLKNGSDRATSSCPHVGGGKGNEHGSRETMNGEGNGPSNKTIIFHPLCNGRKGSKRKRDVRNKECGNSSSYIAKANRHNKNADSSFIIRGPENPNIGFDEPENASSESDDACELPQKRKAKLRSLTDIMDVEKNTAGELIKMRVVLSSGMQMQSTENEADLDRPLQLNSPAGAAIVPRSPHRKRKINAVEEDRELLETTSSVGTAKRLKCLNSGSVKMDRIVEFSDSESGGDRSARWDSQHSAMTQQLKPKRNKAPDINRKMKQPRTDNRTVPIKEMTKINSMHADNPQKRAVSSQTKGGNMGRIPSTLTGEITPYYSSSISGKQVDRTSELCRRKRPEVEGDRYPSISPKKSFLGDFNNKEKVALDLSLNSYTDLERDANSQTSYMHRGIPDLNESFTEKPSAAPGKQLPTIPEYRSSTLHRNWDASCSKQIAREGKRQVAASDPKAIQVMHNSVQHGGTSDDIQTEIVEFLAKNQHERAHGNSRNHILPESINNSIGGSPPVYVDGHPGMINFSFTNARSGNTGLGQGIFNFPQVKNCRPDIGNQDENQFSLFSSLKPGHRNTPFSASNSVMTGSRPTEGVDLLWAPRGKNAPLHLDICQNHSIQPNGVGVHSLSDQRYKGKTVADTKGDERRAICDASAVKEGRIGSSSKSAGTLDAYSNDTIPAMQLLSLMDRGIVSGSSFKVGPNSFLDKPFSPCNHHPRLNPNEKQNDPFLSRSFFSQSVHFSGESLRKSYAHGQMLPQHGNAKTFHLGGPSNAVIQPTRGNPASEVCTLNRNPADFSIPDAKNEFTLSAKDLKLRRKISLTERSRAVNVDGKKRHKARKETSGKEHSRK